MPASAIFEPQPVETAPRDGRWIIGIYDDPSIGEDVIAWREQRTCMLGRSTGMPAGAGQYGAGWVGRDCEELPVCEPDRWRPMPVMVDQPIFPWRGQFWCHLFCEDLPTLHEFAARIGLHRTWFQCPPKASWPHYDVNVARRRRALAYGAVQVDRYECSIVSRRMMGRLTAEWVERVEAARRLGP